MTAATSASTPSDAMRVARLASLLDERHKIRDRLDSRIVEARAAGIFGVAGEEDFKRNLDLRLQEAARALADYAESTEGRGPDEMISKLTRSLEGEEWDLVDELSNGLAEKIERHKRVKFELDEKARQWDVEVANLRVQLDAAKSANALVRDDADQVDLLEKDVLSLKKAIDVGRHDLAASALERLHQRWEPSVSINPWREVPPWQGTVTALSDLAEQLQDKTATARHLSRSAEVFLLRGPKIDGRYDYEVIVRTPSGVGTLSASVRDRVHLATQDRDWMYDSLHGITDSVNTRMRSSRQQSPGVEATDGVRERRDASLERTQGSAEQKPTDEIFRLGRMMYKLLFPEGIQERLHESRENPLLFTTNDLELPLELMHDGENFIAMSRSIGRLPMGERIPRSDRQPLRSAKKRKFLLVYADPRGTLKSAEQEISRLANELRDRWKDAVEVVELSGDNATGTALNDALVQGDYDVIHFAGHAKFDPENAELSGLLLHDGAICYAEKLRRLLAGRPVVFLNACESGLTQNEARGETSYMGRPAGGLATAVVYGGALGCIGTLWPVYDDSASQFALDFYDGIIQGHTLGESLSTARREAYERDREDITWASFALFGDPTFRLRRQLPERPACRSRSVLSNAVDRIGGQARRAQG